MILAKAVLRSHPVSADIDLGNSLIIEYSYIIVNAEKFQNISKNNIQKTREFVQIF